ncbi:MAG: hypothetical protein ABIQ95_06060 [Bdellovibrionia bacterium]
MKQEEQTQIRAAVLIPGLIDLLKDERGQGTVEYILILSVSVVAASQVAKKILSTLDRAVLLIGAQLERDLKTGRLGPSAWQN